MIHIRRSSERGHADHGWLNTYHTFSFANYYDPQHMGFRALRVINEDRVQPEVGFPTHPHRDMEIISYVLEGALAHKDSMGNSFVIRSREVQRMTAGTGITHSECNASADDLLHFLQIWILPAEEGLTPGYEQRRFSDAEKQGRLLLIASPNGRDGSLQIHQNANLYAAVLAPNETVEYQEPPGRYTWVQVVRGSIDLNGHVLEAGAGAAIIEEDNLVVTGKGNAEFLIFDLP